MVKPIVKDIFFLRRKSALATAEDLSVAQDLLDTLAANSGHCVGMAANIISVHKRIEVSYQDMNMNPKQQSFSGFVAQIIRHEMDHCEGILV